MDTRDELLAGIVCAAARIKQREDQLGQTARHLRTRVAQRIEFDGGIFEHVLWTVTNLSFKDWIRIIIQINNSNLSFFITINCFVFVDSNSCVSVTIHN